MRQHGRGRDTGGNLLSSEITVSPPGDATPAITVQERKQAPLMVGADALHCCWPFNDCANGKTNEVEITLSPSMRYCVELKIFFSSEL